MIPAAKFILFADNAPVKVALPADSGPDKHALPADNAPVKVAIGHFKEPSTTKFVSRVVVVIPTWKISHPYTYTVPAVCGVIADTLCVPILIFMAVAKVVKGNNTCVYPELVRPSDDVKQYPDDPVQFDELLQLMQKLEAVPNFTQTLTTRGNPVVILVNPKYIL